MFKIFLSGLFMGFFGFFSQKEVILEPIQILAWQEAAIFNLSVDTDPQVDRIMEAYLQDLTKTGLKRYQQGVWLEDWAVLAENSGKIPLSAASLTKIATSLASLEKWGINHRFETLIYQTGMVENGILQGDLVIQGGGDPLFVWEEAIALGNALQSLGIKEVKGNLVIIGDFSMNFQPKPDLSGQLLKIALNQRLWSPLVIKQYQTLIPNPPKPEIAIAGTIKVENQLPPNAQLLLRHQSLNLVHLLKQMNIYSNNEMAEMLAKNLGGHQVVINTATQIAKVAPAEIQLINGSGLGVENRISPRASCLMLREIDRFLQPNGLTVNDIFPVGGIDTLGTMKFRQIPPGVSIKTGTLRQVSALAGMIPTQERGKVCFSIINSGTNIEQLRRQQDQFLQGLARHWTIKADPFASSISSQETLGDPARNLKN